MTGAKVSVEVVNRKLRPPIPSANCPPEWIKLMTRCWDQEPDRRPTFKEIIVELEGMKFTNV